MRQRWHCQTHGKGESGRGAIVFGFVSFGSGVRRNLSYSNGDAGVGGDHMGDRGDLMSPSWLKLTYRVSSAGVMSSMVKISACDIRISRELGELIRRRTPEWSKELFWAT